MIAPIQIQMTSGSTINAGTVQLGDGTNPVGTLGSGSIVNNAALTLAYGANNGTLPNNISGTGSLQNSGPQPQTRGIAALTQILTSSLS